MGRAFEVRKAAMAKTSAAKTKIYSRFGKEIYMAAKSSPNIDANPTLKSIVARAKKLQVPAHVIDKAIDKAKGGGGEDFVPKRYEGYGPNGSTFIIDCLTDNDNRTASEVRNCFTKCDFKIGAPGSVSYMWTHQSIVSVPGITEDQALEALMEAGVDFSDIEVEESEVIIYGSFTDFYAIQEALNNAFPGVEFNVCETAMVPMDYVQLTDPEHIKMFEKFNNMLDECDDVQNVYHNVDNL